MAVLASIWSYFWAVLTALPIVGFALVYAIAFFSKKNHHDALKWSIYISNVLLIRAVAAAYVVIWPQAMSVWLWIILLFLGIAFLIGWMQVRVRGKISLSKIGFSTWRITFVLFGLAYIMLFSAGIWKNMQFV